MSAKMNPQWVDFMLIKLFTRGADCPRRTRVFIIKLSDTLTPLNLKDHAEIKPNTRGRNDPANE